MLIGLLTVNDVCNMAVDSFKWNLFSCRSAGHHLCYTT